MSTEEFFSSAWSARPLPLLGAALAIGLYYWRFRSEARWSYFLSAVAVVLLTLLSPLDALSRGLLFSAHMAQHLLLLLVAPGLFLASLPRSFALGPRIRRFIPPFGSWILGVAPMWLWHVPVLCDSAAVNPSIHAVQTISLLAMGAAFWWPILAPRAHDRLMPLVGVGYLFVACLACTALGILVTLTPVEVCPVFRSPLDPLGIVETIRSSWGVTPTRDREIGGLLMWIPMCLVYLSAILLELGRWLGGEERMAPVPQKGSV